MSKTGMIRARIEPEVKLAAEHIFSQLGLSVSDVMSMFYRQTILTRGLPFEVKLPNKVTRRAMDETRAGKGVRKTTLAELRKEFRDA